MAHYEIEIKTLLGAPENATALREKLHELDPSCAKIGASSQLNHYFTGGVIQSLYQHTEHLFSGEQHAKFERILTEGADFSVRTREKDGVVLLVVKASLDAGSSANTVSRLEFEEPVDVSLDELDQLVLASGYEYQAKWSRDREEYAYKGVTVCLDRNAGYGYLAEFEHVTDDGETVEDARAQLIALMEELGVAELPQDRLERMFAHYNKHWPEYYGTDKTFVIE